MACRKDLKNIAQGIVSSFISRNNDLNGYWAAGKLYKFAKDSGVDEIRLDIIGITSTPASEEMIHLTKQWNSKLSSHIKKFGIPPEWIKSAIITANYSRDIQDMEILGIYPVGDLGRYTFEIETGTGVKYSQSRIVRCRPHDPSRESRRSIVERDGNERRTRNDSHKSWEI